MCAFQGCTPSVLRGAPAATLVSWCGVVVQAEMLALAKKMLRRKVKDDIVEAAYNRFAL